MRFAIPIIFIGVAVLLLLTVVEPQYRGVEALQERNKQFDKAISSSNELQAVRERLSTRYQNFAPEDIERITKLLPDNIDNVRLILDVDDIARENNMRIRAISVDEGVEDSDNGRRGSTNPRDTSSYERTTLSFSTTASYSSFLDFLRDLEQSLRLVDITKLEIAPEAVDSDLTYNMTLQAYWLN